VNFRTRIFLSSLGVAALTLLIATMLVSWTIRRETTARIERSLVGATRLAAETLSHRQDLQPGGLDGAADAIGGVIGARVTFVAADGTVVGDSDLNVEQVRTVENHAGRPEIEQARQQGLGIAYRHSATIGTDMLYVAVPVRNAAAPELSLVRLALPLTEVEQQLAAVRRAAGIAFAAGLGAALALSWVTSVMVSRRVDTIAAVAQRYAAGDWSRPAHDYGADEIGIVARALDSSAREIGRRALDLASDRARMEAILAGMIEGVLVVNDQGRVQPAPPAGRAGRTALPRDRAPAGHRGADWRRVARCHARQPRAVAGA
jgi:two-component system phosphate regulon sensor histidine kinase PhoR